MSFYNMMLGEHADAEKLLALLRTHAALAPPRYRDCFFDGIHIVVHTRTGGGNREEYELENRIMTAHPWYVCDADDDLDCTYANFYYAPPPAIAATLTAADSTPAERWLRVFEQLNAAKSLEELPAPARLLAEEVTTKVQAALDGTGPGIVEV